MEPLMVMLEEDERQAMLLALAKLSLERPGWDDFLNKIAQKMDNEKAGRAEMYESFRQTSRAEPRWGIWDHFRKEWIMDQQIWEGSYHEAESRARDMDDKGGKRFYEPRRRS